MHPTHGGKTRTGIVSAIRKAHILSMRRRERPSGSSGRTMKGRHMKTLIARLRVKAAEHATYARIRNEIAALSQAEALDLGIFPGDADRIARKAVWG